MATTIAINGVGFSGSVEVQDGESYADALRKAGFESPEDLNIEANGVEVESPEDTPVPTDEAPEVSATPKNASLG